MLLGDRIVHSVVEVCCIYLRTQCSSGIREYVPPSARIALGTEVLALDAALLGMVHKRVTLCMRDLGALLSRRPPRS